MSYSEAFMGTGRKQTDVEKLAASLDKTLLSFGKFKEATSISSMPIERDIKQLIDLLAEASSNLQYARNLIGPDEVLDYFLTRIAPLVKQHRGE